MSSNNQAFLQQKESIMRNFKGAFNCTIQQSKPLAVSLPEDASKILPGVRVVGSVVSVPGLSDELPQIVAGANQRGGSLINAEAGRLRLTGSFQGHLAVGEAKGRSGTAWSTRMCVQLTRCPALPGKVGSLTLISVPLPNLLSTMIVPR